MEAIDDVDVPISISPVLNRAPAGIDQLTMARREYRPVPLVDRGEPEYPTIQRYLCERRAFLKELLGGALCAAVGQNLLAGCALSHRRDGREAEASNPGAEEAGQGLYTGNEGFRGVAGFPGDDVAPEPGPEQSEPAVIVEGESIDPALTAVPELPGWVRLPERGFTEVYLRHDEFLHYSVEFYSPVAGLVEYFKENRDEGIAVVGGLLSGLGCSNLEADTEGVELALRRALQDFYSRQGADPGARIESLRLLVENCGFLELAGIIE